MNYDLIVIGNTAVGRAAAFRAVLWEARVALVTQNISSSEEANSLYNFTLSQLTEMAEQGKNLQAIKCSPTAIYQQWTQEVIEIIQENSALTKLAAKGVDIISGEGEFCRLPKQAFIVNNESLKARAYLVATETTPMIPELPNLSEIGYLTISDIRKKPTLETLPQNLTIVGDSPAAVACAQNLAKLNKTITLATKYSHLFPVEDRTITHFLQAQLEADGVQILTQSPLIEIRKIGQQKWLQLGKYAIETEELILFPETKPNIKGLNLEGVKVAYTNQGLIVNEKLQTTNRNIYACGCLIGGYPFLNLAQSEATVAVKNALFFPRYTINYQRIPCVISTHPPFGRVGMTEAQAKHRYGEKTLVIKQHFKTNLMTIARAEMTGLMKIVVDSNGEILGGHIFGKNADELVSLLALAISKKMKIKDLYSLSFPSSSVANLIAKVVQQWETDYAQSRPFLRWLRRRYFLIRRS